MGGQFMTHTADRYAIFRKLSNGSRIWVCRTNDLDVAQGKLMELVQRDSLEYFIYDFVLGTRLDAAAGGPSTT